jgi:hypothetical protein
LSGRHCEDGERTPGFYGSAHLSRRRLVWKELHALPADDDIEPLVIA